MMLMTEQPPQIDVLIVDDDRDIRAMFSAYLEHVGCTVRTACDGGRAIDQANLRPPDVIVMDLVMPCFDGWTALKRLKGAPSTAHIPIIALSGLPMAREQAKAVGCDAFLAKPCRLARLWREIRRAARPRSIELPDRGRTLLRPDSDATPTPA
jgi:two-component system cell cycle response regulator DivK